MSYLTGLATDIGGLANALGVPSNAHYAAYSKDRISSQALTAPVKGQAIFTAIYIPSGQVVTNICWLAGSTGLTTSGTAPHFWMALYNSSVGVLGQSTDVTNATWSAGAIKSSALSAAFTTTYSGLYYCSLMVDSGSTGTQPTLSGISAISAGVGSPTNMTPLLCARDSTNTGLTDTAAPTATLTANTNYAYCYVN